MGRHYIRDELGRFSLTDGMRVTTHEGTTHVNAATAAGRSLTEYVNQVRASLPKTGFEWQKPLLRPTGPWSFDYPLAADGTTKMPPDSYRRHLGAVLDVGSRALVVIGGQMDADPDLRAKRDTLVAAEAAYAAVGDDPRAWTDLYQRSRAAQAVDGARRMALHREQEILLATLDSVRDFGGAHHTDVKVRPRGRADALHLLHEAELFYPTDWVAASSDWRLNLSALRRASYDHDIFTLNMDSGPSSSGPGGHNGADGYNIDVTIHELGHRMERIIPGLTQLEFTYVRERARRGNSIDPPVPIPGYTDKAEVTHLDHWANPYAGKTYEATNSVGNPAQAPWEAFQVGMQDLFSRQHHYDAGDELQAFVVGALLTLG